MFRFKSKQKHFVIRSLDINDYYRGFYELLNQLTDCPKPDFNKFEIDFRNNNSSVFVVYEENPLLIDKYLDNYKLIGSGSVLIENKFIRGGGKVAHIEDIVVDKNYRGYGLGKAIIDYLVRFSKGYDCYKVILNCSLDNVAFYERCGFKRHDTGMALYFETISKL